MISIKSSIDKGCRVLSLQNKLH